MSGPTRRRTYRRRHRRRSLLVPVMLLAFGGVSLAGSLGWKSQGSSTASLAAPPAATSSSGQRPRQDTDAASAAVSAPAAPSIDVERRLPAQRVGPDLAQLQLRARLADVVESFAAEFKGSQVGVAVRDDRGTRILDVAGGERLLPASTMKTVTAATVLTVLGPDARFTTTVGADGPISEGVLTGDLVIHGGGDAVLTTDDYRRFVYPSRPSTSIEKLADKVAATGIQTITGDVIGDEAGWGAAQVAAGWRQSYLDDQDARRITPLTVDAGLDVQVDLPADQPPQVILHPSADPALRTASVFAGLLAKRGIAVKGKPKSSSRPVPTGSTIARIDSPKVAELLRFTLRRSDNHLADTMLRAAAFAATGDGSWASAQRTATAVLDGLGVPAEKLRATDGSGLSRLDRLTAGQLADLDVAMMNSPHADVYNASLAVAGKVGTLKHRLLGTAGVGRVVGKTGTLEDVKAVVAHVAAPDDSGRRLHVAVIGNEVVGARRAAVSVLADRLQLALVDAYDGCVTTYGDKGAPTRRCP